MVTLLMAIYRWLWLAVLLIIEIHEIHENHEIHEIHTTKNRNLWNPLKSTNTKFTPYTYTRPT